MDKFQEVLPLLIEEFSKINEVLVVYLYGSVARGDYSVRHSDMDLFIITKNKVKEGIKKRIQEIGAMRGVDIHLEFQTLKFSKKDYTLIHKMLEEGKVIYSKGILVFESQSIGLRAFKLIEYSTKPLNQAQRTRLTQIIRGRKGYKGLADNESIFSVGKGALMVKKDRVEAVTRLFEKVGIKPKTIMIVYA